jgi:hypothetical protein
MLSSGCWPIDWEDSPKHSHYDAPRHIVNASLTFASHSPDREALVRAVRFFYLVTSSHYWRCHAHFCFWPVEYMSPHQLTAPGGFQRIVVQ